MGLGWRVSDLSTGPVLESVMNAISFLIFLTAAVFFGVCISKRIAEANRRISTDLSTIRAMSGGVETDWPNEVSAWFSDRSHALEHVIQARFGPDVNAPVVDAADDRISGGSREEWESFIGFGLSDWQWENLHRGRFDASARLRESPSTGTELPVRPVAQTWASTSSVGHSGLSSARANPDDRRLRREDAVVDSGRVAPAQRQSWVNWATVAIQEVLGDHCYLDDRGTYRCHTPGEEQHDQFDDLQKWREHVAPLIAEHLSNALIVQHASERPDWAT